MADITVTAANVQPSTTTNYKVAIAGEAIAAGKSVYIDSVTKKAFLADNNLSAAAAAAVGVAICTAAIGQPVVYATDGAIAAGATLVKGTTYCVSATAGGICPQADLASGNVVCILGVALDTANLALGIRLPGVTL